MSHVSLPPDTLTTLVTSAGSLNESRLSVWQGTLLFLSASMHRALEIVENDDIFLVKVGLNIQVDKRCLGLQHYTSIASIASG